MDTSAQPLVRLAGPSAVLAGALVVLTQLLLLVTARETLVETLLSPAYQVGVAVYVASFGVLMIALVATYSVQARQAGAFGVVALCLAIVGTVDMAGNMWFDGFVGPWLADVIPAALEVPRNGTLVVGAVSSYLLFPLGWVLYGVASLRAGVFPRWLALGVAVGGLFGYFAGRPPLAVPFGLAIAALGAWLVTSTHSDDERPTTRGRVNAAAR